MAEATLSKNEKDELARFVAGTGENYSRYVTYATERGWYIFTRDYFRRWVQNHRNLVKKHRAENETRIQQVSMMGKELRVAELESDLQMLNFTLDNDLSVEHVCEPCSTDSSPVYHTPLRPEMLLKYLDQKRKLLQAISQERGEWNRPDESKKEVPSEGLMSSSVFDQVNVEVVIDESQ